MSPRAVSLPQNLQDSPLADQYALDDAIEELRRAENMFQQAVSGVRHALDRYVRNQIRRMQREQKRDGKLAYRIAEVAKLTGISEASVVRSIERGELRAVKLNRDTDTSARLILAADLERWLAGLPER